ncbi:hypothetical protein [Shinella sp.]|uniref:hypothetical protein n=1 Tax=Shinella sp. TaxID=1870904 RepID=UPI00301B998D
MRQVVFVLAILGAVLSGWIPAVAATLAAAQPAGLHAMHRVQEEKGGEEHGKAKPTAHPLACSACFAIEAARLEPSDGRATLSSRLPATVAQLAGLTPPPLDPPPRFRAA